MAFRDFSRDKFIPLFDANKIRALTGFGEVTEGLDLTRIDKSTVFEFGFNPQTETYGFIDSPNDETNLVSYQLSMEQEIVIDGNNPAYALLYEYSMAMPTGSDAEVPMVIVAPSVKDPTIMDAFMWEKGMLAPGAINTVDKKLTFTMNFNGEMQRGTATISNGKVTFVPATPVLPSVE